MKSSTSYKVCKRRSSQGIIAVILVVIVLYTFMEYFYNITPVMPEFDVLCKSVIDSDLDQINITSLLERDESNITRHSNYTHLTKQCKKYKSVRGFINKSFGPVYASFPIAYSILLYKEVEQAERLLRAIYRPNNLYCFHVDLDAPHDVHVRIAAISKCFWNVFVASKKEAVVYAGWTRLQADLNCMQDLMKHNIQWKYVINLASQSFPLKTNEELVQILKIYDGANDIEGITDKKRIRPERLFVHTYISIKNSTKKTIQATKTKKSEPPHGVKIVKGSAYGVFSRAFVEFVLTNQKAIDIYNWMKDVYSPDEYYWATLNHNPVINAPGGYTVYFPSYPKDNSPNAFLLGVPDEKPWLASHTVWEGDGPCDGKFVRGACIYGVGDLQRLTKRKELFANKFYLTFQPAALNCMEQWLHNKTVNENFIDLAYYRNLSFIRHPS